jgi:ribosome-associated protein
MSKDSDPKPEILRLDQFLQLLGITDTGGQAKLLIQGGGARVNGQTETRRRRKLVVGDIVEVDGTAYNFEGFES